MTLTLRRIQDHIHGSGHDVRPSGSLLERCLTARPWQPSGTMPQAVPAGSGGAANGVHATVDVDDLARRHGKEVC